MNKKSQYSLDCIYVAASTHDARYTRICIASIRYFYPHVPIKLLVGAPLEPGLAEELKAYWNVGLADVPEGNWGWGFVKLQPLFGPDGERFMVLDSDTVFTGDVLRLWAENDTDFLVDDEPQSKKDTQRLYYDWQKVATVVPHAQQPQFVFNSGQWFGTAGVLTREDFSPLLDWSEMPPRLRHPSFFMPGDQGILNYVLNQKSALEGIQVGRHKLMRWPGHGMDDLNAEAIAAQQTPPLVIHWAGMKKASMATMVGADVLHFFEKQYYKPIPNGGLRHLFRQLRSPIENYIRATKARIHLKLNSHLSVE